MTSINQPGLVGFLSGLAGDIEAARRSASIAATVNPLVGGLALPQQPQTGLLGQLLGLGAAAPADPIQLAGAVPQAGASGQPSGGTPMPTPGGQGATTSGPNIGGTTMPTPPGSIVDGLTRGMGQSAGGPMAYAPTAQPYSPLPSGGLPMFAASQGVPSSVGGNTAAALSFYQSKGLSPVAAAALVGGFHAESGKGLDTLAANPGDGADGSTSQGIAQWNGDRARGLQAFATSRGLDPRDLNTQLEYSWAELNGPESRTLAALQAAGSDPAKATAAALGYERPAGWSADNPYGAKTFGKRLGNTVGLINSGGSASPYGALAPMNGPVDTSALPTMAASGMGARLSPATPFPNSGALSAPVVTDAGGNALNPDGTTTASNFSPSTGIVTAPASRAIAAAAPMQDGGNGSASSYTAAPGTAPGVANAQSPTDPRMQQPSPAAAPLRSQVLQRGQVTPDMIKALVSNEDTQAMGLALWQAMLTKSPINLEHFEGKDGRVYAFNPSTGAASLIADGGVSPVTVSKNATLVDPRTGRAIYDNNSADTRTVSPAEYGRYGIPAGTPGPVQVDSDGKLLFPMKAGQAISIDNRSENAEAKVRGEGVAKRFNEIAEAGSKADEDAAYFDRFGDLLATVPTGARTAVLEKVRQMTGVPLDPNTDNVQALNSAIQYLAPRLRVPGSGAQSDRELSNFLSSIPSLMGTPGGNAHILATLQGVTAYKQQRAKIANDYQFGDISAKEAQQRLDALPSPFTRRQPTGTQGGAPAAPAPAGTPAGARQGIDGNFYVPDPSRPGKYLRVNP